MKKKKKKERKENATVLKRKYNLLENLEIKPISADID